jgi:hypothetical protein
MNKPLIGLSKLSHGFLTLSPLNYPERQWVKEPLKLYIFSTLIEGKAHYYLEPLVVRIC